MTNENVELLFESKDLTVSKVTGGVFPNNCDLCSKDNEYIVVLKSSKYRFNKRLCFCEEHLNSLINGLTEFKNSNIEVSSTSNIRKTKIRDGEIECFMVKGQRNPCGCGSNVYHQELLNDKVYGVCNACDTDIYEIDVDDDYIINSEWK